MKVMAIDHNIYLFPQFNRVTNIETRRHQAYPKLHALLTLSPFDAVIWDRVGVRSRYIPNPTGFELQPVTERPNNIAFVGRMDANQK
jgi:hypothetical protein